MVSNGLKRTPFAPQALNFSSSRGRRVPERIRTGRSFGAFVSRIADATSNPSFSGSVTSTTTRSGASSAAMRTTSSPVSTATTEMSDFSKASSKTFRMVTLSSTSRSFFRIITPELATILRIFFKFFNEKEVHFPPVRVRATDAHAHPVAQGDPPSPIRADPLHPILGEAVFIVAQGGHVDHAVHHPIGQFDEETPRG